MTWETLGGGGAHPYNKVIPTAAYTASNEDFVISEGHDVTLPAPVADGVVGISAIGSIGVSTPSGTIENIGDTSTIEDTESAYFVSDGTNWYLITPRTAIGFGSVQHIETQIANGDATIDFTNVFTSDYDRYVVYIDSLLPASNTDLRVRYSSDEGSTWDSGASDYARAEFGVTESGGTTTGGSGSTSDIILTEGIGDGSSNNDIAGVSFTISDPIDSNRATTLRASNTTYTNTSGNPHRSGFSGGIRLTQSAIDSIQFFMSSGNIDSGIFSVFGVSE